MTLFIDNGIPCTVMNYLVIRLAAFDFCLHACLSVLQWCKQVSDNTNFSKRADQRNKIPCASLELANKLTKFRLIDMNPSYLTVFILAHAGVGRARN